MHEQKLPSDPPEPTLEDFQRARALPPPAFPPGFRRVSVRRRLERQGRREIALPQGRAPFPDGAYISPDDPLPARGADAADPDDAVDPDDVVVTGMGDDPHLDLGPYRPEGDPNLAALAEQVGSLAESLRRHGEAGLREYPGMSRFEATLRAYCAGWLEARRAEEHRS